MGDLQVLGSELGVTAKKDLSGLSGVITQAAATIQTATAGSTAATTVMPVALAQWTTVAAALLNTGEKVLVDEGITLLGWVAGEFAKMGPTAIKVQQ